jgi:hypothetical protein
MKFKLTTLLFCAIFFSGNANAWKFYWTPAGAISEAVAGTDGSNCVSKGTQSGDIVSIGNRIMIVKSVSGVSPKCAGSDLSVGALLEVSPSSSEFEKVLPSIDIPDGYKRNQISEQEKIKENLLLSTIDTVQDSGLNVFAINKSLVKIDSAQYASNALKVIEGVLEAPSATTIFSTAINGARVWQNQVSGVFIKGNYKLPISYLQTLYEGDSQFVLLRQWTGEKNFPALAMGYENTAKTLKNLVKEKSKSSKESVSTATRLSPTLTPTANEILNNSSQPKNQSSVDTASKLETLKQLLDKGLITQKDYDLKKAQILKSM